MNLLVKYKEKPIVTKSYTKIEVDLEENIFQSPKYMIKLVEKDKTSIREASPAALRLAVIRVEHYIF